MAVKSYQRGAGDAATLRLVKVNDERPDEIDAERLLIDYFDVDRYIESSTTVNTLAELTAQGYTTVKVLDRKKIEQLIRKAVNEAIESRAAGMVQQERLKIEQESRKRLEQLIAENSQGQKRSISEEVPEISTKIAGAVRAELKGLSSMDRLENIEEKLQKLITILEKVETLTGRARRGAVRHTTTRTEPALDELRSAVLEEIFKTNLELRGIKT